MARVSREVLVTSSHTRSDGSSSRSVRTPKPPQVPSTFTTQAFDLLVRQRSRSALDDTRVVSGTLTPSS